MNTITLPDHISFEDIAIHWTNDHAAIKHYSDGYSLVQFCSDDWGVECLDVAAFDPKSRELQVFYVRENNEDYRSEAWLGSALLDFIKERSHG